MSAANNRSTLHDEAEYSETSYSNGYYCADTYGLYLRRVKSKNSLQNNSGMDIISNTAKCAMANLNRQVVRRNRRQLFRRECECERGQQPLQYQSTGRLPFTDPDLVSGQFGDLAIRKCQHRPKCEGWTEKRLIVTCLSPPRRNVYESCHFLLRSCR